MWLRLLRFSLSQPIPLCPMLPSSVFVPVRSFCCTSRLYLAQHFDDDQQVYFIDHVNKRKTSTLGDIKALSESQSGRDLVRITYGDQGKEKLPTFKYFSTSELGDAVRLARDRKTGLKYAILDGEKHSVRQKSLDVSTKMLDHDFEIAAKKVDKFLDKGYYVYIRFKVQRGHSKVECKEWERRFLERCSEKLKDKEKMLTFKSSK